MILKSLLAKHKLAECDLLLISWHSMQGPPGRPGEPGRKGPAGQPGKDGERGKRGSDGRPVSCYHSNLARYVLIHRCSSTIIITFRDLMEYQERKDLGALKVTGEGEAPLDHPEGQDFP